MLRDKVSISELLFFIKGMKLGNVYGIKIYTKELISRDPAYNLS